MFLRTVDRIVRVALEAHREHCHLRRRRAVHPLRCAALMGWDVRQDDPSWTGPGQVPHDCSAHGDEGVVPGPSLSPRTTSWASLAEGGGCLPREWSLAL